MIAGAGWAGEGHNRRFVLAMIQQRGAVSTLARAPPGFDLDLSFARLPSLFLHPVSPIVRFYSSLLFFITRVLFARSPPTEM